MTLRLYFVIEEEAQAVLAGSEAQVNGIVEMVQIVQIGTEIGIETMCESTFLGGAEVSTLDQDDG